MHRARLLAWMADPSKSWKVSVSRSTPDSASHSDFSSLQNQKIKNQYQEPRVTLLCTFLCKVFRHMLVRRGLQITTEGNLATSREVLQLAEKLLAFGVECNRSGVGVWCETFINIILGGSIVALRLKQTLFSLLADSQTFAGVR